MDNNELQHWGIKGMRWGVRRYQNKDGSLTPAGKKHYDKDFDPVNKVFKTVELVFGIISKNNRAPKYDVDWTAEKRAVSGALEKIGQNKLTYYEKEVTYNG